MCVCGRGSEVLGSGSSALPPHWPLRGEGGACERGGEKKERREKLRARERWEGERERWEGGWQCDSCLSLTRRSPDTAAASQRAGQERGRRERERERVSERGEEREGRRERE